MNCFLYSFRRKKIEVKVIDAESVVGFMVFKFKENLKGPFKGK